MRGPAGIVELLDNHIDAQDRPRLLMDVIKELIIENRKDISNEQIAEQAEKWLNATKSKIYQKHRDATREFRFLSYQLSEANDDYIHGSCLIFRSDTNEEKIEKVNRSYSINFLNQFSELSYNEFELLCGRILTLFNVEKEHVTRSAADQGIDFYGQVPYGDSLKPNSIFPGAEKQMKFWLVGQAKHFSKTKVSTKDIRELVGSVLLAKSKVYAGSSDPLRELAVRECDPVFFVFFTTGFYTRDAIDVLRKAGIVFMDGPQLAAFLADSNVGMEADEFSSESFQFWLNG